MSETEHPSQDADAARARVRRLILFRRVLMPLSFGMGVAAAVNLVLAILRPPAGEPANLLHTLPLVILALGIGLVARLASPRLDEAIQVAARGAPDGALASELLGLVLGFPFGPRQPSIERELVRQLSALTASSWERQAKELKEQTNAIFEVLSEKRWSHESEEDWAPALFAAIARCGRTEYIRPLETIVRSAPKCAALPKTLEAASQSLEALREREKRLREQAVLLRPSQTSSETLLHPVLAGREGDVESLLRTVPAD